MVKLKKFLKPYRQAGAFHGLLAPHRFIDDHVFLTKGNQLGALFGASGIDYECLTEETLETCTRRAAAAWRSFDERFRIYQYVVKQDRAQIEHGDSYSNPVVTRTIHERNAHLESKPEGLYRLRLFYAILLEPSLSQSSRIRGALSNRKVLRVLAHEELIRAKPTAANPQGYVYPVLANVITALRHAPEWSGVLTFDEFQLAPVAVRATPWGAVPNGSPWSDQEDRLTAEWLQHNGILADVNIAAQAAQTVAKDRFFHPVRKYVESIQWDGIERLDRWLSIYLGAEDNNYTQAVGARWLISAVARIYRPGAKADCCLILEGPQGIKKSTALKTLAGPYFTDELADLGSKDSVLQTHGVWIIELSELDTLSRSEVSRIKAFMSRTTDRFRPPYGKRLIESPRQCVFARTVNHSAYLRDDTGARRFWPVGCGVLDIESLARDRDQLLAEAKARFDVGGVWWLDNADLVAAAAEEQAERFESNPWEELIAHWVENRDDASVSDTLSCCLEKPRAQWAQVDKNRVARCFRALGWERYRELFYF